MIMDLARRGLRLCANPISMTGVAITSATGFTMVGAWILASMQSAPTNPYLGIVLFLVLPGAFVFGLVLIPVGMWFKRRKNRREGLLEPAPLNLDLSTPSVRNGILGIAALTLVNIALVGTATAKGTAFLDSNAFCGTACHTVMQPEYTAFLGSPHERVGCSKCHIGPGADWFVKSKLSGLRQVWGVATNRFRRPVPSPVHDLRPARETCEQCHWPQKFHDDKLRVIDRFQDDAQSTPSTHVLMLKVGGQSKGIHGRHLDDRERITYISHDPRREKIDKVIYRNDRGETVEYFAEGYKDTPGGEARQMDCVDCHNRPTHAFDLPERAVDKALASGKLSRELPYARKWGIEVIQGTYASHQQAEVGIPEALSAKYAREYPEVAAQQKGLILKQGQALVALYKRNVFPEMKVKWGTHPNHIGHEDSPGCFRCHDGEHKAKDGRAISSDCSSCHNLLAQGEANPKILKEMGIRD